MSSRTAERPERRDVERGGGGRWPVRERSLVATVLGVPPWAALAVAAVFTVIGVVADLVRVGTLGSVFVVCYLVGCVLAVVWVRRRSLFTPMVQPPLLLAVVVPAVILLGGSPRPGTGISERLLTIGAPLVNSFPAMAWTTAAVVALGVFRLLTQRPGKDEPTGVSRRPGSGSSSRGPGATRGAGRTSTSPRR